MGHRANFAIREGGDYRLFYSHWGALSVPQDLFWGPEHAEAFIAAHEELVDFRDPDGEGWLDEVWAEGGAALDKDEKVLLFFGGDELGFPPYRDTVVALMQGLWEQFGWTVRWAENGILDVAAQVGEDPTRLTAPVYPPFPAEKDNVVVSVPDSDYAFCTVFLLPAANGSISLFVGGMYPSNILMAGPSLLDWLQELRSLKEVLALIEDPEHFRIRSGIYLDEKNRQIAFVHPYRQDTDLPFVRDQWPGWSIVAIDDELPALFKHAQVAFPADLIAVDPEPELPSPEEVLETVVEVLFREDVADPAEWFQEFVEELSGEDQEPLYANPAALEPRVDIKLDVATRQKLFGIALAKLTTRQ